MTEKRLTREAVRESLATERRNLLGALQGLAEEEMTRLPVAGDWSVRDIVAHILAWEEEAVMRLDLLAAERSQDIAWIGDEEELEAWNARAHQRYGGLALAEVMRRLADVQERILASLESLSEERLTTDAGPASVRQWLPNCTYAHEQEHCADILAWRRSIETTEA